MAAASCVLSEDQFLCSICLDVFTDPVSTPCGHNFCKNCITEHWNVSAQCQCPLCKRLYTMRPELHVNTFISQMAAQFKQSAQKEESIRRSEKDLLHPSSFPLEVKKDETGKDAEVQRRIQERREKIEEIRRSVENSMINADREIAEGVQVFTALMESVDRSQTELIETILQKQRAMEKRAEGLIQLLEQEISELQRRSSAVKLLNWTETGVHPSSYDGTVARAMIQLEKTLNVHMKKLFEAELRRVQQYRVHVNLDPDVVHPRPSRSNDRRQGGEGNDCRCVLSKRGFTSGRFYFDVKVGGCSMWTLGVTGNTNIKGQIRLSPNNGFWTVCLKNQGGYAVFSDPSPISLSLKSKPERVGVFVDYEEGLVSFYDVDSASLIFFFTGFFFTSSLYPFFSPCWNDGVQIHAAEFGCVLQ